MTKSDKPWIDMTPEDIQRVMDEMKAKFTADDLYEYIEGDMKGVPADEMMANAREIISRKRTERAAKGTP